MISVLIPIFNYHSFPLVKEIHSQLTTSNIPFEIICIDDASSEQSNNQQINNLRFCKYSKLKKNIGRSKIRNLLAEQAQYKILLFLDCDVHPCDINFIDRYLQKSNEGHAVICGGVSYHHQKPKQERLLRWVYGKKREEVSLEKRTLASYRYFFSSNFLIDKTVFDQIHFNDNLVHYGYEDLLFSEDLKKKNIVVSHINNPVFHLGLDTTTAFLKKNEPAIKNLHFIYKEGLIEKKSIKLLQIYLKLKKTHLLPAFLLFYKASQTFLKKNLKSAKPSLFLFDIYRLGLFCKGYRD